jgi:hypothetical protein
MATLIFMLYKYSGVNISKIQLFYPLFLFLGLYKSFPKLFLKYMKIYNLFFSLNEKIKIKKKKKY